MSYKLIVLVMSAVLSSNAFAKLHTQTIEYKEGETILEGYLAYDDALKSLRPGVIVVHEWTGLGDYVKARANQLAKMGYVAFAADIYGKGVRPAQGAEAAKIAGL